MTINDNRLSPNSFFSVYQIQSSQFVMRTAKSEIRTKWRWALKALVIIKLDKYRACHMYFYFL